MEEAKGRERERRSNDGFAIVGRGGEGLRVAVGQGDGFCQWNNVPP